MNFRWWSLEEAEAGKKAYRKWRSKHGDHVDAFSGAFIAGWRAATSRKKGVGK